MFWKVKFFPAPEILLGEVPIGVEKLFFYINFSPIEFSTAAFLKVYLTRIPPVIFKTVQVIHCTVA